MRTQRRQADGQAQSSYLRIWPREKDDARNDVLPDLRIIMRSPATRPGPAQQTL